jgi:hypothetical protein
MSAATTPCSVEFEHYSEFRIRDKISLADAPALIVAIINAVPRDAHGTSVLDQIFADVRAHRPRDRTNAERQRRFRRARKTASALEAISTTKAEKAFS